MTETLSFMQSCGFRWLDPWHFGGNVVSQATRYVNRPPPGYQGESSPGAHATDRMKELGGSGPMGDPADFGRAVAFLCSASAAFITGTTLTVDGGATLGI